MRKMIQIKGEEENFKLRASGLLVHNGKVLTVDMDDSGFLCLPGGYIELGEDSKTAMIREMEEETKYHVEIENLVLIVENFFINKKGIKIHEIAFYYLLKLAEGNQEQVQDYEFLENDNGTRIKHNFKWINLKEIKTVDLRPQILKDKLASENFQFEHIIVQER